MQRAAGDSGDRRDDGRVREIELGFANRCARCGELRSCRAIRGRRFLGDALADSRTCEQTRETIRFASRLIVGRFCLVGRRLRLRERDLERRALDLEQRRAGAHEGAFVVQPLLHDAGDARADLDFLRAFGAADRLEHDRHGA